MTAHPPREFTRHRFAPMRLFLPLFLLIWGGLTLAADWFTAAGLLRAVRSGGWATAEGTVTHCELKHGRKNSVSLDLAYTYSVAGVEYTGRDYEPGPHFLPGDKWPKVRERLPVGSKVTVYHDPNQPSDAVLNPGVKPEVLPMLLALTPFNVVAVGLLVAWWWAITGRRQFDPARHVYPAAHGLAARLSGLTPLSCFALALLVSSFASVFVVAVGLHSLAKVPPSWWVGGGAWAAVLGVSVLAVVKWGKPRELVEGVDTLTLPNTSTGRELVEIPHVAVAAVEVRGELRQTRRRAQTVFVVMLLTAEQDDERRTRFAEYGDRRDAEALAGWVRGRLGLAEEPHPLGPSP